jgi:ABC-type spermidine/putrescine transport system permease subunit II
MARSSRPFGIWSVWVIIILVLVILYAPTLPVILLSFTDGQGAFSLAGYAELLRTDIVLRAIRTTAIVGIIVAALSSALGLLAAISIREFGLPRLILLCMLLPLFIPGVSMGLASALLFKMLGIAPSLITITIVQTMWALPFSTLIILTVMAAFDPAYIEAAYVAGANRLQAFRDIEFPLIAPGIYGAASFAFILSINETIRTSSVQGPWNTIATYIWSSYKQVGLSPVLYSLMGLIIISTFVIAAAYLAVTARGRPAR